MSKYQPVDGHMHPSKKLTAGQGEPFSNPKRYG